MQGHPHWSIQETLRLCQNHWDLGVVGLDFCTWQPEDSRVGDPEAVPEPLGLGGSGLDLCTWQPEDSRVGDPEAMPEPLGLGGSGVGLLHLATRRLQSR
ncbi:hypothetical protein J6590_073486 [Homalodisca vitripennis]|nr:hypothetical protein J6590_073486 [Homalodisca vitripennis]